MDGEFRFYKLTKSGEIDFTAYAIECVWSGSMDEAGRCLEFSIAYTTPAKDKAFLNFQMDIGDTVAMKYTSGKKTYSLFAGRVFLKSRNSESYTMQFKAYDNLIYLAKSEVFMKFQEVSVKDVVGRVCSALGVPAGKMHSDLDVICSFIADGMTGTETIQRGLEICRAWYGYRYKMVLIDGKLDVVRADGQDAVEGFTITDKNYLISAEHGVSIEDMINQVAIADSKGTITGYSKLPDAIEKYGLLQKVYRSQQKADNQKEAALLLQREKEHSAISAIGNIQCISGFAVEVQEEQIKGKFLIMSDSHRISNNTHTMDLTLDYIVEKSGSAGAVTETL